MVLSVILGACEPVNLHFIMAIRKRWKKKGEKVTESKKKESDNEYWQQPALNVQP